MHCCPASCPEPWGLPLAELQAEPAQPSSSTSSPAPGPHLGITLLVGPPANARFKRAREEAPASVASHGFRPCRPASCLALQERHLRMGRPWGGGALLLSVCLRSLPTTSEHSTSARATHCACLKVPKDREQRCAN